MAEPVGDSYTAPVGAVLYAGRFAPAVLAGGATMGDIGASGDVGVFGNAAVSGDATMGSIGATGDLSYVAPVDASRKFRFQKKRLFQRAHAKTDPFTYVNSLGDTVNSPTHTIRYDLVAGATNCHKTVGANSVYICFTSRWIWTNLHGDYLDSNQVQQGASPWASAVFAASAGAGTKDVDITSAMQFIHANQRWVALLLKRTSGAGTLNVNGVLNDVGGTPPTIEIVYSDASTATLPAWYTGSTITSTSYINAHENTIPVSSAANGLLEFDRDDAGAAKTITSATLKLRHSGVNAAVTFGVFVVAPLVPSLIPAPGLAAGVPFDGGVAADGRVLLRQLVTDDTVIGDVLDVYGSGTSLQPFVPGTTVLTQRQEAQFDPSLWGQPTTGIDLSTRHPHKNYDPVNKTTKWSGYIFPPGVYPSFGPSARPTMEVVKSTYTQYGFTPMAPGLGAIHLVMPARGIENGMMWRVDGETGADIDLWLPRSHIGAVRRLRFRYYVLLGDGWEPGDHQFKLGFVGNTSGIYPEQAGITDLSTLEARPSDNSGKFFGGAQHLGSNVWIERYKYPTRLNAGVPDDTLEQVLVQGSGYGTGSGGQTGYQGRFLWLGGFHKNLGGPGEGGFTLGTELYDFQGNTTMAPSLQNISGWDASWQSSFSGTTGLGHIFKDGLWRCVEIEWQLNPNQPYSLPARGTNWNESGFQNPPTGYLKCWIDGVLASTSPNFGFGRLPKIDWALQVAKGLPYDTDPTGTPRFRPITNVTDDQYLGFASIAGNFYYGGRSPCPVERHTFFNGLVVAVDDGYIGPMSGVQRAHGGLGA